MEHCGSLELKTQGSIYPSGYKKEGHPGEASLSLREPRDTFNPHSYDTFSCFKALHSC